jgi:hypothetical protein
MWEASLGKLEMGATRAYDIIFYTELLESPTQHIFYRKTRWIIGYVHGSMKISK